MLSQVFASVLRSGRAEFNKRYADARRVCPELDAAVFSRFLENCVDPFVEAINRLRPERTSAAASAAYDIALELSVQGLIGSARYQPLIESGWKRILTPATALLAGEETRAVASVCNALHRLATTPGTRPEQWLTSMEEVAPSCGDLETLLRAGQVCAWRAGLAHFRQSAIAAADALPEAMALRCVGAEASGDWKNVKGRLLADPWFDPANTVVANGAPRVAASAGSFRGFGGLFPAPPDARSAGPHFVVRSGDEAWLLTADAFGATFHRVQVAEFEKAEKGSRLPPGWRVGKTNVIRDKQSLDFAGRGEVLSFAANETTLALTFHYSHSVVLIPLKS